METKQILSAEPSSSNNATDREFSELYFQCYNDLYYYSLKLSGSADIAKDCIQDLFLQFWRDYEQLNHVSSKKAYLLKCLRRRVIAFMIKEKKIQLLEDDTDRILPIVNSAEEDFFNAESERIQERRMVQAISELTVRQQEVLFLRYKLGYNFGVICDIMEIKYQSVRNLLSEAVKVLRIKLNTVITD